MTDLNQLKVSIITPTFNDAGFVLDTLKSILNQTHSNIELIVIDDCSTDNTVELIKSLDDSRIVLLQNERNSGAAFSRNKGIKNATGDYIAFLDGDDLWYPTKIAEQLSFMLKEDIAFSCTGYRLVNSDCDSLGIFYKAPKKVTHRKFLRTNYVGCLTVMYKRSIYPDLSIPTTIAKRNDYAMWLLLSEKTPCFYYDKILSLYRKRSNSISSDHKQSLVKYHSTMIKELYGFGSLRANWFAIKNIFFYVFKQILYRRKFKEEK